MKIILLEDIKNLGKKHDIKEVANGYAKNFLLPKQLVKKTTAMNLKELAKQKAEQEIKEKKLMEKIRKQAEDLEKTELNFTLKMGKKQEAYGSIQENDIKKLLESKGFKELAIKMETPIKSFGDHKIKIDLNRGVKAILKIKINQEEK